jgi:hypothetical protein
MPVRTPYKTPWDYCFEVIYVRRHMDVVGSLLRLLQVRDAPSLPEIFHSVELGYTTIQNTWLPDYARKRMLPYPP